MAITALALDTETTKFPNAFPWMPNFKFVSMHFASSTNGVSNILFNHNDMSDFKPRSQLVKQAQEVIDEHKIIVAHNLKFDLHQLRALGIDFSKKILYCTQVAEYLLNYQRRGFGYSLDATSQRYGITDKIDRVKTYWDAGIDTDSVPLDILMPYGDQDTVNALTIFYKQQPKIAEYGMKTLFRINMETIRILQEMEWNGMRVNLEKMQHYAKEYDDKVQELAIQLRLMIDKVDESLKDVPINLGSGEHLSALLYGGYIAYKGSVPTQRVLKSGEIKDGSRIEVIKHQTTGFKIKPLKNTKTAKEGFFKTDAPTLTSLKLNNNTQRKFVELLMETAKLSTLRDTYFIGLQKNVVDRDVIHQSLNQTITVTGRLSCSSPNAQNMPRGNTGPIKELFITRFEKGEV